MKTILIYKDNDDRPTITIESESKIDSSIYLFKICKEEIYIDENLIETIYHKK